ncbi:MAG: ribosome maturation factor RimM [Clostridia bacterium]|nr:ribosome maturation factor RimM [Clostridia bacterium]
MENLFEIGKIVRTHGIKGAVKIISNLDADFSMFKHVYLGAEKLSANITKVMSLNNDAYSVCFDVIKTIEEAEKFKNVSVYVDRTEYKYFENKIYVSDLIGKAVVDENGQEYATVVDYEDYGATTILTLKVGAVSYTLPFVKDIIVYNKAKGVLVCPKQKFEDLRV